MSDEIYEWHTASEQRGNRSPSHQFYRLHPLPCYIYCFPLLRIHPAWCFWIFFFLSSFILSTVDADQQRKLHCTTYCCYLFPSGDCIYFFSTLLTCLHFWRADRRASWGRILLLCSSLSFLSFPVCGSRSRV